MATNYANEQLTRAIKNHLLSVDTVPPTTEVSKLAGELAQVCLTEFNAVGLGSATIENLFTQTTFKAKARGVE